MKNQERRRRMKTLFAVSCLATGLAGLSASAAVTNVLVRQRWPWSPAVDIDFTVTGTDKIDVEFTAVWSGRTTPLALTAANGLSGRACGLGGGETGHVVWDPRAAGFTETLADFRVTATPVAVSVRQYLVIDLTDGSHEYLSAPPEGGFNTDVYKTSKMAFRRIPAATFNMGLTSAVNSNFKSIVIGAGATTGITDSSKYNSYAKSWGNGTPHAVTLTDDYYVALFRVTTAQYSYISAGTADSATTTKIGVSYATWRGSTNETQGINWPVTGYNVYSNSFFGKFRTLVGNALTLDMMTDAQWELAARAGTDTLFDIGGDATVTWEQFLSLSEQVRTLSTTAGSSAPNTYGLYDMLGGGANELVLDRWQESLGAAAATNPVGPTTAGGNCVMRGDGKTSTAAYWRITPFKRKSLGINDTSNSSYGPPAVRAAIHLNSVFE